MIPQYLGRVLTWGLTRGEAGQRGAVLSFPEPPHPKGEGHSWPPAQGSYSDTEWELGDDPPPGSWESPP